MKARKIVSTGLAGALAVSMAMPMGAFAAVGEANDAVIDSSKKGSFTIHKLIENDGKNIISDGHDALDVNETDATTDHSTQTNGDGTITVTNPFNDEDVTQFDGSEDYDGDTSTVATHGDYVEDTTAGNAHGSALQNGQDGTGTTAADGQISVTDDSYLPLDGIVFSHKKIADIVNVSGQKTEGNTAVSAVGTYFTNLDKAVFGTGNANDTDEINSIRYKLGVAYPEATIIDGQKYFTTQAIEKCLAEMNAVSSGAQTNTLGVPGEVALTNYLRTSGTAMTATDEDGVSESGELTLGLYLVGETDITAHDGLDANGNQYKTTDYELNPEYPVIDSEAAPFLVSLPTTNVSKINDNDPGTVWEYDIDVYPKDQTNSISKRIIDPDDTNDRALRIREDFQIGDSIEQVIYADAPMLQPYTPHDAIEDQLDAADNNDNDEPLDEVASYGIGVNETQKTHEKFVITDTMSESLTFDGVSKVAIIPKVVNPQYDTDFDSDDEVVLTAGTDYRVVLATGEEVGDTPALGSGDHTFQVELLAPGLAKLDAIEEDSQVVVFFSSTINCNAALPAADGANDVSRNVGQGIGNVDFNVNHPNLTWKNSNTLEKSVDGNYVYDYTYELNLTKSGLEDASNAAFLVMRTDDNNRYVDKGDRDERDPSDVSAETGYSYLYDDPQSSDKTKTAYNNSTGTSVANPQTGASAALPQQAGSTTLVKWVQEAPGVYHVYDPDHDAATDIYSSQISAGDGSAENANTEFAVRPAADGTLILKGFDSDIYTFKELATEQGKNLLKSTFDIEFIEDGDPQFSYANNEGYGDKLQDGALIRATLTIDEAMASTNSTDGSGRQSNNLDIDTNNKGVAKLTVDNYKAVTLRTGGEGRTMLYMGGAALLGMLTVAVVADKKRKTAKQ